MKTLRQVLSAMSRHNAILFSLLYLLFLLPFLARNYLLGLDESTYANIALNVLKSGRWLPFEFEGHAFIDKPPLVMWVQALSMLLFGVGEWGFRFPSAIAGALCLYFTWKLAARIGKSEGAGFFAAGLLASSEHFILFSRAGNLDAFLLLCLLGGWWEALRALDHNEENPEAHWKRLGFWLAAGLLVKSLFALAFLLPAVVAFFWTKVRPVSTGMALKTVAIPALAAVAFWFGLYGFYYGRAFFEWELFTNVVFRVSTGPVGSLFHPTDVKYPAWLFYAELSKNGLAFLWPLIPLGLAAWVKEARTGLKRRRADPLILSGVVILFSYLIFVLMVIRPLINYLLPLTLLGALCTAALWRKPPCLKTSLVFAFAALLALLNGYTRHGFIGGKLILSLLPALAVLMVPDTKPHHWGRRLRWLTAGLLLAGSTWKAAPYLLHPPNPCAKWVDVVKANPASVKGETLLYYGDPVDARVVQFYCDYRVQWTDKTPPQRPRQAMMFEFGGEVRFLPALNSN